MPRRNQWTDGDRRAAEGVRNRLRESSAKIESYERHLAAERRRRDLLILKLAAAGETTRAIGAVARISSPAVTYATRRARTALNAGGSEGGAP